MVHYSDGSEEVTKPQEKETNQLEVEKWVEETVYLDSETKERRKIYLDSDRDRLFFFAEPLDFDKDDNAVARYWLDECEGWKDSFKEEICRLYAV